MRSHALAESAWANTRFVGAEPLAKFLGSTQKNATPTIQGPTGDPMNLSQLEFRIVIHLSQKWPSDRAIRSKRLPPGYNAIDISTSWNSPSRRATPAPSVTSASAGPQM